VAFSPDGTQLASGFGDRTVRLWDAKTGQELQKLEGHIDYVVAVAFSPDGTQPASGSRDRTVRLWDAKTGQELQKLEDTSINDIRFTKDNQISSPILSEFSESRGSNGLVLKNEWIEYRDKRLLWLPHEYRSDVSAMHGNMLAIGRPSGLVSFLQITWP
jgi:WD40 repeat protein